MKKKEYIEPAIETVLFMHNSQLMVGSTEETVSSIQSNLDPEDEMSIDQKGDGYSGWSR